MSVQVVGVRFRDSGKVYYFDPAGVPAQAGDTVVVDTAKGQECGEVVTGPQEVDESEVVEPLRKVIRLATERDLALRRQYQAQEARALRICQERVAAHNLPMKLVGSEYTFDGSRLTFFFTADGRVDFRELVRDLASIFHTRIELRQIGVRDQARMVGGLGPCGRPLCCRTFLGDFVPVSIKMAKEQNLSLNPSKISGMCGRLMCCLMFECDSYGCATRACRQAAEEAAEAGISADAGEEERIVAAPAAQEETIPENGAVHPAVGEPEDSGASAVEAPQNKVRRSRHRRRSRLQRRSELQANVAPPAPAQGGAGQARLPAEAGGGHGQKGPALRGDRPGAQRTREEAAPAPRVAGRRRRRKGSPVPDKTGGNPAMLEGAAARVEGPGNGSEVERCWQRVVPAPQASSARPVPVRRFSRQRRRSAGPPERLDGAAVRQNRGRSGPSPEAAGGGAAPIAAPIAKRQSDEVGPVAK